MSADAIRARLDEIEEGFGYYHRLPLLAALRAVLDLLAEVDIRAAEANRIHRAIATALDVTA